MTLTYVEKFIIVTEEISRLITLPLERLQEELSKSFLCPKDKKVLLNFIFFNNNNNLIKELRELENDYKLQLEKMHLKLTANDLKELSDTDLPKLELYDNSNNVSFQYFCSPELKEFLKKYMKGNGMLQSDFAFLLGCSRTELSNIMASLVPITPNFIENLYKNINSSSIPNLKKTIKTCIKIDKNTQIKNLFNDLIALNYWTSFEDLGKYFNVTSAYLRDLCRNRDGLNRNLTLKVKDLILNTTNISSKQIDIYNEVAFCVLIRHYKTILRIPKTKFCKLLNVTYSQYLHIEKCLISVPENVKNRFKDILNKKLGINANKEFDNLIIDKKLKDKILQRSL